MAPRLHNLQHIVGFLRRQRTNQPLVQDQQIFLLVGFKHLFQRTAAAGNTQFIQQFRHTDVLHLLEAAAGCIAQSAGNVGLAITRSSLEDNVVAFVNVLAGGKPQHLCLVQLAVLVVFNAFHSGRRHGEVCIADKPVQFVALSAVPFRIYQQAQALLEAQFIERGIFQLVGKFRGHGGHLHRREHIHRCLVQHQRSPPFRK